MTGRRSFLALVGGTLLSGSVLHRASAQAPALILPPSLAPAPAARPLLEAMLAGGRAPMDAILFIGRRMPAAAYLDWLESGLQQSMLFAAPDDAVDDRRLRAAEARYGSLSAAHMAGAL